MFNYDWVSFSSSIVNVPYVIILSVSICISSLLVWISINTFKTYVTYLQGRIWVLGYSLVPTCEWKHILVYSFGALTQILSSWHTVLLTFDRYIAICYPFQYHKIISPKIQKILIIVVWMISIFENLCSELYIKAFKCEDNIQKRPHNFGTSLQLSHLTVIFTLHFIMYSRIWWIAHKMRERSVEAFSDNPPVKRWILDKATMTLFYVVVLSYVIWLPYMMTQLIPQYFYLGDFYVRLTIFLAFSGSFVNNIIYVIINKNFQDGFRRLSCKGHI